MHISSVMNPVHPSTAAFMGPTPLLQQRTLPANRKTPSATCCNAQPSLPPRHPLRLHPHRHNHHFPVEDHHPAAAASHLASNDSSPTSPSSSSPAPSSSSSPSPAPAPSSATAAAVTASTSKRRTPPAHPPPAVVRRAKLRGGPVDIGVASSKCTPLITSAITTTTTTTAADHPTARSSPETTRGLVVRRGQRIRPSQLLAVAPLHEALVVPGPGAVTSAPADRRSRRRHATSASAPRNSKTKPKTTSLEAERFSVAQYFRTPWVSETYWRSADWDARLVTLLLYHYTRVSPDGSQSSNFSRYLHSLPAHVYTAADLSGDSLADVQYQPLIDAVECFQYRVQEQYARFLDALHPSVHSPRRASASSPISYELFYWAFKIVHSRAFSIPSGGLASQHTRSGLRCSRPPVISGPALSPVAVASCFSRTSTCGASPACFSGTGTDFPQSFALVPGLDMVNHGVGDLAELRFDHSTNAFQLFAGEKPLEEGESVLISYGDHLTNDDLFLLYGFVQAGNPADVYEVEDLDHWAANDPVNRDWNLFDAKLRLLNSYSLVYDGRKYLLSRTQIDLHMIVALRVLLATPKEFSKIVEALESQSSPYSLSSSPYSSSFQVGSPTAPTRGSSRSHPFPVSWARPISIENELRVWSRIHVQLERLLAEYPTSLDLDEEMILLLAASSLPPDPTVSTPLLFRVEKKRILRDAIRVAGDHAARLSHAHSVIGPILRTA